MDETISQSTDYGGLDVHTLSDPSLYRLLDSQDAGWRELPEEYEFTRLESSRLLHIGHRLRSLISKRRRHYAY